MKRIVFLLVIILFCSGCQKTDIERKKEALNTVEEKDMENIHTDLEQIMKWFPNLEGVQSAQWEILMGDEGNFIDLPAPGSYTASGYILLNPETAAKYLEDYDWQDAEPGVNFQYISPEPLNEKKWMFSRQFDKDFRPLKFIGKLWFNGEAVLFTGGR